VSSYILSRQARRDVAEIVRYIAIDNPDAALRVKGKLLEAFALLARRPGLGHARPDLTVNEVRFWTVMSRYSIVYRPDGAKIAIVCVAGPGRDVIALLR
jgi:plasmid stabilization system protein ParE